MSLRPIFIDIELPSEGKLMELCIGFSWGGDANKPVARTDSSAFKDAVLAAFKTALNADWRLVSEMAKESHPLNGLYRYRGGRTGEKVQAILDTAVETVTQRVKLSRPCYVVLVEQ